MGTSKLSAIPAKIRAGGNEVTWSLHGCFGILTKPAQHAGSSDCCVLFLNAGGVRHIGPNRLWVEAARRWADSGVASLRLDLPGIGEGEGEQMLDIPSLYQERLVDQLEDVISSLRATMGARCFVAVGLCAGAFWAFHLAIRNKHILGAILLNPRLFYWDPEVDQRRTRRRATRGIANPQMWKRLAGGDISKQSLKRAANAVISGLRPDFGQATQLNHDALANAWATLDQKQARVSLIFSEGEPLLQEMEDENQMPPDSVRLIRIRNTGHTFRSLWAQRQAHQILDTELDCILNGALSRANARSVASAD